MFEKIGILRGASAGIEWDGIRSRRMGFGCYLD